MNLRRRNNEVAQIGLDAAIAYPTAVGRRRTAKGENHGLSIREEDQPR